MSTHGQTSAGFDKEDRNIILRVVRRIKNTSTHHIMTAGFKHEAFADPVEFPQEMLTLFIHGGADEGWSALLHEANGIAAGVGVDADEGLIVGHRERIKLGFIWAWE
jgi:hypothetical protein